MIQRALAIDLDVPDDFGNWLAGFTDGEGCFDAILTESKGYRILALKYEINLRADDRLILERIKETLRIGRLYLCDPKMGNPQIRYVVRKIGDLYHVIVPLFEKYPLRAKKAKDCETWKKIVRIHHHYSKSRRRGGKKKSEPLPQHYWDEVIPLMTELHEGRQFPALEPGGDASA